MRQILQSRMDSLSALEKYNNLRDEQVLQFNSCRFSISMMLWILDSGLSF